ncbi:MAG: putative glycosidase [Anaerolineaceae bacterium]|nr:MAG: putative glycosidase [Anaerolineaceae bacterium]
MKNIFRLFNLLLAAALLVTACAPKATATPAAPVQPDLYLNILWHQHQPFYAVDQATGLVSAPWVRFHAAKDYVDMAQMLQAYPDIHVTFNLTPSLIQQIDAFNDGQRDKVWAVTLIPAGQLTDEDKTYILQRFFDVNGRIIEKFPRYVELQQMRGGADEASISAAVASWSVQDFLDLQVLFNLAWTDPNYLAGEPLASLVAKGSGFTEQDKQTVLDKHAELMAQVIPVHKAMQDSGQIEVTFTPYAHPILPLLIDTNLASQAVPDITLPTRFVHGEDAIQQLQRGIQLYEDHFGKAPNGMWPAEGSVAQMMVTITSRAGVQWMVTDEGILAHSLDLDFTRNADGVPNNATALYRPYTVGRDNKTVTIFFRDTQLSNKVSFDYSQLSAQAAVDDFMGRLHAIRDEVKGQAGGPYVVTVILDGENAWEWYEGDGKDFLNGLYSALSADPTIKTVTSTEFLALYDQTPESIPELWAGSWDNATFETWIGEPEENTAWNYLGAARATLEEYLTGSKKGTRDQASVDKAYDAMLAAEGSDWFWWYGADKDSGNDAAFDAGFRETLGQVYDALGLKRPASLSVPIIQPTPVEPDASLQGLFTPVIDGRLTTPDEWQSAGEFLFEGSLTSLQFGFDKNNLYLRGSAANASGAIDIYFKVPYVSGGTPFADDGRVLGIYATHRLHSEITPGQIPVTTLQIWNVETSAWEAVQDSAFQTNSGQGSIEIAIPLAELSSALDAGDSLQFRVATQSDLLPASAPGRMLLPDLGRTTWIVDLTDPADDDHGPGSYTYPTDNVFKPGVFDLLEFKVGQDGNNLVFSIQMGGPVENPWGAPNGLAIQLVDIYIDTDGAASGARLLRNGRNAALASGYGWDYALTVSGWNYGVFTSASPETADKGIPLTIFTDPGKNLIIAKIPLSAIPGDPAAWKFAVVVLSNDGYGINGVRDVTASGGQWAAGGAPADKNHTRILDYLWPADLAPTQEEMLSAYTPSQSDPASLGPDDFPQLQMVP